MKNNFLCLIIIVFFVSSNIFGQQEIYIPLESETDSSVKYKKNVKILVEVKDTLNLLNEEMLNYEFRKGVAYIRLLSAYSNLKVNADTFSFYAEKATLALPLCGSA